jgi:hypothetical protein
MTKAKLKKVLSMWKKGHNVWEISQITGVSEQEIYKVIN